MSPRGDLVKGGDPGGPERAGGDRRPLAHPLAGADPATLVKVLWQAGGLPPGGWVRAGTALAASVARSPLSLAEAATTAVWRRGRPLEQPPLFLVGHWRSGTTHLYNVLGKAGFGYVDPISAGLPWDTLLLGRWLRPLLERALPKGRFIDAVAVNPDSPQEDETAVANMTALSYFHAIYFPRAFEHFYWRGLFPGQGDAALSRQWERRLDRYLWKLERLRPGRRLVIKNPVYTARVTHLAQRYPGARFLHIVRNPHEVFASTRSFFTKMFEALALQPWSNVEVERVVLETYPRLMQPLLEDAGRLPAGQYAETHFEDFERDPLGELERIYRELELDGFVAARPAMEDYLGSIRSYSRAARQFPARDIALVENTGGPFLQHWGYGPPGETEARHSLVR